MVCTLRERNFSAWFLVEKKLAQAQSALKGLIVVIRIRNMYFNFM